MNTDQVISPTVRYRAVNSSGTKIFYREAGEANAPAVLLLHGFPTSSHMFRNLIPYLADRYRVIAPDYPGYGQSDAPDFKSFTYTFEKFGASVDGLFRQLGVQRYAIPGRTIETWVRVDKPGVYYGECNQICGTNHSRMPISVRAVSQAEFETWLAQAKAKFANAGPSENVPVIRVASAQIQH